VTESSVPLAYVVGHGTSRSIARNRPLRFDVAFSALYGGSNYSYIWNIYKNGVKDLSLMYRSISSADPSVLHISPYSLTSGSSYEIRLEAVDMLASTVLPSSVFVDVIKGNIVALISNGAEISVPVGSNVTIDASKSYDLNIPENELDRSSHLSYKWSCRQLFADVYGSNDEHGLMLSDIESPLLTMKIVSGHDIRFLVYELTVVVSSDTRSDNSTVRVQALPEMFLPVVSVHSETVVKPMSTVLKLFGEIDRSRGANESSIYSLSWTSDDMLIDLASIALSPVSAHDRTMIRNFNLVLPRTAVFQYNVNRAVSFRLVCSISDQVTSWATITILVNRPPSPGTVAVFLYDYSISCKLIWQAF
jgi:hypothetical protein